MTVINRRQFMAGLIGASAIASSPTLLAAATTHEWILSASSDKEKRHWISGYQVNTQKRFQIPVPDRAHDVLYVPQKQQALYFARRPGKAIYVVDLNSGTLAKTIRADNGYHFFGHGCLSQGQHYLYTTENDYDNARGVIGVYDISNYQRIDTFDAGGIGPHELALMPDGKTFVVAVGGILTHPSQPRKALNIDTMQSSLAYIDISTGKVLDNYYPEHPQMSIRHLDVSDSGQVIMGVQFQGDKSSLRPLVLSHQGENTLQTMQADELHWLGQQQYIASVAVSSEQQLAVTATPRGGNISVWNMRTLKLQQSLSLRDVAGAAYDKTYGRFIVSNGLGELFALNKNHHQLQPLFSDHSIYWDNHLTLATV